MPNENKYRGLKLRIFKLITGVDIICSVKEFDYDEMRITWGKTPTNETHDGGIMMVNVEYPALILMSGGFKPYMEGLHKNMNTFLIKEEHCMHILTPSDEIGEQYFLWVKTNYDSVWGS